MREKDLTGAIRALEDPLVFLVGAVAPEDDELAPNDPVEIAEARWGTLEELAGPLRERLLATGRAFWRYRVALHDAALRALL